jgi:hypothetical protein
MCSKTSIFYFVSHLKNRETLFLKKIGTAKKIQAFLIATKPFERLSFFTLLSLRLSALVILKSTLRNFFIKSGLQAPTVIPRDATIARLYALAFRNSVAPGRVARFFLVQHTKTEKYTKIATKFTKWVKYDILQ